MSWWTTLAGGAFGFMIGGPIGALIGASIGSSLGGARRRHEAGPTPGYGRERAQLAFFAATFGVRDTWRRRMAAFLPKRSVSPIR